MRQAVRDVVTGRKFTMAINYHTFGSPSFAKHGLLYGPFDVDSLPFRVDHAEKHRSGF